jgi:predicted enzyme related to lactoylglutathione lyase
VDLPVRLLARGGGPAWSELVTVEADRAAGFYRGVFGPGVGVGLGPVFEAGRRSVTVPAPTPGEQAHWQIHFAVADVDDVARRARSLGGRIDLPAHTTPHGRAALLHDPQGGPFAVVQPQG